MEATIESFEAAAPALLPPAPSRAQIEALEDTIAASGHAVTHLPTVHYFWEQEGRHYYGREITIPAGFVLTGKVHRFPHINVVPRGKIRVWTEDGMKTLTAPFSFPSRAGTKRAGLTFEETVWLTIHENPTGREDPEEMERLLAEPNRPELMERLKTFLEEETPCLS